MRRREFLGSTAAVGAAATLGSLPSLLASDRAPAPRGQKLTPPKEGTIPVAVAISKGTTWIDWVGPQAVFDTWRFDPIQKKHVPRFRIFTVSSSLDPVDHLIP